MSDPIAVNGATPATAAAAATPATPVSPNNQPKDKKGKARTRDMRKVASFSGRRMFGNVMTSARQSFRIPGHRRTEAITHSSSQNKLSSHPEEGQNNTSTNFSPTRKSSDDLQDSYNTSTLRTAFNNQDQEQAKQIITDSESNYESSSYLLMAIHKDDYQYAKFILNAEIPVDYNDHAGVSFLHAVLRDGRIRILDPLIDKISRETPEKKSALINAQNADGLTPLHLGTRVTHGSRDDINQFNIVKTFDSLLKHIDSLPLDQQAKILKTRDKDGATSLQHAAEAGNTEAVTSLLKRIKGLELADQLELINTQNSKGLNAIHLAVENGHSSILTPLLEYTAGLTVDKVKKQEIIDSNNNNSSTPLHTAISKNYPDIARALLDHGASINSKTDKGSTALHIAVSNMNISEIILLSAYNPAIDSQDKNGSTPLHIASKKNNPEIVKCLADKGADVCVQDNMGNTALHLTANESSDEVQNTSRDRYTIAETLLRNNPQHLINLRNSSGNTPIHCATIKEDVNMITILLTHKAKINVGDNNKLTPLHLATSQNNQDIIDILINETNQTPDKKITQEIISAPENEDGSTPFLLSIKERHTETMEKLLDNYKEVIQQTNSNKSTALHLSINYADLKTFALLLNKTLMMSTENPDSGININSQDNHGFTPLQLAALNTEYEKAKLLLENGADFDPGDQNSLAAVNLSILKHGEEDKNSIELLVEKIKTLSPEKIANFLNSQLPTPPAFDDNGNLIKDASSENVSTTEPGTKNPGTDTASTSDQHHTGDAEATPFRAAIIKGHPETIKLLTGLVDNVWEHNNENGNDALTISDIMAEPGKSSAFHLAIEQNYPGSDTREQVINSLLDIINRSPQYLMKVITQRNTTGSSPINLALEKDQPDVAELLLNQFDKLSEGDKTDFINSKNADGFTPLQLLVSQNSVELAEKLLETGKKYINIDSTVESSGKSALHLAVENSNPAMVELLLKHKATVDLPDNDGLFPIHLASNLGYTSTAKLLLEHKANVDSIAGNGLASIHMACKNNDITMAELLLQHNATIDLFSEDGLAPIHQASRDGHVPMVKLLLDHKANIELLEKKGLAPIHLASANNDADMTKALIGRGADIFLRTSNYSSAIHIAASNNNESVVNILIDKDSTVVNQIDSNNSSPLHLASANNHVRIVHVLLRRTEDMNKKDNNGETALHIGVRNGHLKVVQRILNSNGNMKIVNNETHIDEINKKYETALHLASANSDDVHFEIAKALLNEKASPVSENINGETPLLIAIEAGSQKTLKLLLKHKATINSYNLEGDSAMHLAIRGKNPAIINTLLENIDELSKNEQKLLLESKDRERLTLLQTASEHGDLNTLQWLLNKNQQLPLAQQSKSFEENVMDIANALHLSCQNGSNDVSMRLLEEIDSITSRNVEQQSTSEKGIKSRLINSKDKHGSTPLHLSIKAGKETPPDIIVEIVKRLTSSKRIKSKPDNNELDTMDDSGQTPMHLAASKGYLSTVKLLKEKGAKVNCKDHEGQTPENLATQNGHTDVVKLLT